MGQQLGSSHGDAALFMERDIFLHAVTHEGLVLLMQTISVVHRKSRLTNCNDYKAAKLCLLK